MHHLMREVAAAASVTGFSVVLLMWSDILQIIT